MVCATAIRGLDASGSATRSEREKMAQALQAATWVNAKILRLEQKLGAIELGMAADLIAVPGDPTLNVQALREVRFVMKAGTIYKQP